MPPPTNVYRPYLEVHKDPQGPNDQRPSALKIIEDQGLVGKLSDKVALVTGGTAGIGIETARALHATGMKVYITARSTAKADPVVSDILSSSPSKIPIGVIEMDLSSFASIRKGASSFLSQSSELNILITNAGVMATPQGKTADGFETQFGTNHLGHFLLFQLLRPALLSSSTPEYPSRLVTVSSAGHRFAAPDLTDLNLEGEGKYNKWGAYGAAKTANIWMANAADRRYKSKGLRAFSVHPGTIFGTELLRHSGTEELTQAVGEEGMKRFAKTGKNIPQGAATQVWAAVAKELNGRGGEYLCDCGVAPGDGQGVLTGGADEYKSHAYDEAGEEQLWEISCKSTSTKDE